MLADLTIEQLKYQKEAEGSPWEAIMKAIL